MSETGLRKRADGVVVYGAMWCGDCVRSKALLDRVHVPYTWIDTDAEEGAIDAIIAANDGRRSIPVIVLPDGSHLTEPSDPQLRAALTANSLLAE
ncbi:MAG: NrdH-redoxin [Actinobacteria bacterium]|nr:NrdH-redoxin [Actinomycetota bacterium]